MNCFFVGDFSCSCWKSHICFHWHVSFYFFFFKEKVKHPCHSPLNFCQHCWHLCFKESSHNQYCSNKNINQMTTLAPLCGFVEFQSSPVFSCLAHNLSALVHSHDIAFAAADSWFIEKVLINLLHSGCAAQNTRQLVTRGWRQEYFCSQISGHKTQSRWHL